MPTPPAAPGAAPGAPRAPGPAPAERTPAPAPAAPGAAGAVPAGGASAAPGATSAPVKLTKDEIEKAIKPAAGDLLPGVAPLANTWKTTGKDDPDTVKNAVKDSAALAVSLRDEWRKAKNNDSAFVQEYGASDPIAVQKFADISSERYYDGDLAGDTAKFYQDVAGTIISEKAERGRVFPVLTGKRFPYLFKGQKIDDSLIPKLTHRTHSVRSLADSGGVLSAAGEAAVLEEGYVLLSEKVHKPVADVKAAPGSAADAAGLRRQALRSLLRKGTKNAKDIVNPSQPISAYGTWFTPSDVKVETPNQGLEFQKLMTLGALQPEWYADGALALDIDKSAAPGVFEAKKPTAFDGLLSAQWTARNQTGQTFGVTGGGIEEYVAKGPTWAHVTAATPAIPAETELAAIEAAAQRVLAALGQIQTGSRGGRPVMTDVSSVGEEVLRGNMTVGGDAGAIYNGVNAATQHEQNSPTGAPAGPKAAAPGGIFDPARGGRAPGGAPGARP